MICTAAALDDAKKQECCRSVFVRCSKEYAAAKSVMYVDCVISILGSALARFHVNYVSQWLQHSAYLLRTACPFDVRTTCAKKPSVSVVLPCMGSDG